MSVPKKKRPSSGTKRRRSHHKVAATSKPTRLTKEGRKAFDANKK